MFICLYIYMYVSLCIAPLGITSADLSSDLSLDRPTRNQEEDAQSTENLAGSSVVRGSHRDYDTWRGVESGELYYICVYLYEYIYVSIFIYTYVCALLHVK